MPLSPESKKRAADWLSKKWTQQKNCSVCGANNWIIGDHLVSPLIQELNNNVMIGGQSYPQFMIICTNCGKTHYFNAVVSGVVLPEKGEN